MTEESISIEATNEIRISLGLKPIPVPSEPKLIEKSNEITLDDTNKLRLSLGLKPIVQTEAKSQDKSAEEYQEQIRKKEREAKITQNLEISKSKAAKRRKINISQSLLEDNEQEDTGDWLSKIKKPSERKEARKAVKTKKVNNDGGVEGVKVGHSIDDINNLQQEDVILTLKDRSIHDDEDELESDLLVKKQNLEKQLAEKLRTNKYKKFDGLEGEEKSLLERYDEELNGENSQSFVLNGDTIKVRKLEETEPLQKTCKRRMEFKFDDDEDNDEFIENSDYAKAKPIKMKKIKKKGGNSRKKESLKDEDGDTVAMETVELKNEDLAVEDDFELQSILALKRLKTQKKTRHAKPEDIANEISEDKESEMTIDTENQGLVIDENSEFLSSIRANDQTITDSEGKEKQLDKPEQINTDHPMVSKDKTQVQDAVIENGQENEKQEEEGEEESAEEVNFNGGLGSLLGFLKSKNIVQEKSSEQAESDRQAKDLKKKLDLEKLKTEIEKRIYEENLREDSSFKKLSKKEREEVLESELQQFKDLQNSDEIAAKLKDYQPEVKLRYIDEYGREMNTKEAYKHLSHQFHGKGPSKSKVSKKLKKVEEERKQQYKENSLLGELKNNDDSGTSQDKVGVRLQ